MSTGEYSFEFDRKVNEIPEYEIICLDPQNNEVGSLNFELAGLDAIKLRNIEVNHNFRRRGLGRELLNHLKQVSQKEFKATRIDARISPLNPRNRDLSLDELIMFFQGNGFQIKPVSSYEAFGTFRF